MSSKSGSDATYPKNRLFFWMKLRHISPNRFCKIYILFQTHTQKERQTSLDASRKKASRTLRRASPILLFSGSKTPAKVLKPPFSVFRISLLQEMALIS